MSNTDQSKEISTITSRVNHLEQLLQTYRRSVADVTSKLAQTVAKTNAKQLVENNLSGPSFSDLRALNSSIQTKFLDRDRFSDFEATFRRATAALSSLQSRLHVLETVGQTRSQSISSSNSLSSGTTQKHVQKLLTDMTRVNLELQKLDRELTEIKNSADQNSNQVTSIKNEYYSKNEAKHFRDKLFERISNVLEDNDEEVRQWVKSQKGFESTGSNSGISSSSSSMMSGYRSELNQVLSQVQSNHRRLQISDRNISNIISQVRYRVVLQTFREKRPTRQEIPLFDLEI